MRTVTRGRVVAGIAMALLALLILSVIGTAIGMNIPTSNIRS
jgi:hypothetical protein